MTVPMLTAVVRGYEDHIFDLNCAAILSGYYSGYYTGSKRPKSPNQVMSQLQRARQRRGQSVDSKETMDAKVKQFQEREERMRRFLDGRK